MRHFVSRLGWFCYFSSICRYAVTALVIFVTLTTPTLLNAQLKECLLGANDGKKCTAPADCPGGSCVASTNDINDYANKCYQRLGIKPIDPAKTFKCTDGLQLVTSVDNKIVDINCPDISKLQKKDYANCAKPGPNPDKVPDFPATCDNPTWILNGRGKCAGGARAGLYCTRRGAPDCPGSTCAFSPNQCYGNSFIQPLTGFTGLDDKPNLDVLGALQCRKKTTWDVADKDYTDIAMILHNRRNGQTCWFQTDDSPCFKCVGGADAGKFCAKDADCRGGGTCTPTGEARCDGTSIPAPQIAAGAGFWWKPFETAKLNCVRCHDNGPWMNSRWMDNTVELRDTKGTYLNHGYGLSVPIDVDDGSSIDKAWAPTQFIVDTHKFDEATVKKFYTGARSCNGCHKIHIRRKTPDLEPRFGNQNYQTFQHWLNFSTGYKAADGSQDAPRQVKDTDVSKDPGFSIAYWMSTKRKPLAKTDSQAAYEAVYRPHVDQVRACMDLQGRGGACKGGVNDGMVCSKKADCGAGECVGDCQEYVPEPRLTPAARGTSSGARIKWSIDGGVTWTTADVADPPNDVGPFTLSSQNSVLVDWEADPTFIACTIVATFPPAVVGPAPQYVSTASNWGLLDSLVDVGTLTIDGSYRFDMHCDEEVSASVTLQLGTTSPTLLKMQAIVNNVGGTAAEEGTYVTGPTEVTTKGPSVGTVDLFWNADNVQDGTCSVMATTGYQSSAATGFIPLDLLNGLDQTYTLSCRGDDSVEYQVAVTVHPLLCATCD